MNNKKMKEKGYKHSKPLNRVSNIEQVNILLYNSSDLKSKQKSSHSNYLEGKLGDVDVIISIRKSRGCTLYAKTEEDLATAYKSYTKTF